MFGLLESLYAENDGCGSAPLGDNEGLSRRANLPESGGRVLTQVGDRDDLRELRHSRTSDGTSKRITKRLVSHGRASPIRNSARLTASAWAALCSGVQGVGRFCGLRALNLRSVH